MIRVPYRDSFSFKKFDVFIKNIVCLSPVAKKIKKVIFESIKKIVGRFFKMISSNQSFKLFSPVRIVKIAG